METEKTVLLQVKRLIQIIFKFMNEKKLGQKMCILLSPTKHLFEGHQILCTKYRVAIL